MTACLQQQGDDGVLESDGTPTNSGSLHPPLSPPCSPPSARRRKVRFDEHLNQYHSNSMLCREDYRTLRYSSVDYARFKQSAQRAAQEMSRRDRLRPSSTTFSSVLETVHRACLVSSGHDDEQNDQFPDRTTEDLLKTYLRNRLGLEFMAVESIQEARTERRSQLLICTHKIQRRYSDSELDSWAKQELLQRECKKISEPSLQFAQYLAKLIADDVPCCQKRDPLVRRF